jgi:3-oxoacyl-[acyl-carrier protein] reductase
VIYGGPVDTGLAGTRVLVTGASGGIGGEIARAFAGEGARLALHHRTGGAAAEALAAELDGVALRADLTVEAEVERLVSSTVAELGGLEVLVANAGSFPVASEPVWELGYERWRATLTANVDSVFLTCRAFLRHVRTTGLGSIVIIGSTAGRFGEADHADYAASKAALVGLALSLKNEIVRIAPAGRVNVVAPGWTATHRNAERLDDPAFVRHRTATMALPKLGRPTDVARAAVVLASDRISGHITGEVVTVAGGMEGRLLRDPS